MTALALVHPEEPTARTADQYLFGPDLMVAPVLTDGARSRTVHFFDGQWLHLWPVTGYDPATRGRVLEARAVHTGRSARNHLLAMAATTGIGRRRVEQVIDMVGLSDVAHKRVGGFSLGMGQRLGIASALLADPGTMILDEPVNGLDPDGIRWIRNLLKSLAAEGRTIFLSSHLMSEMALTADHVIVVGKGRLLRDQSMAEFIDDASVDVVKVRSPETERLAGLLAGDRVTLRRVADGVLEVEGLSSDEIGIKASEARITLYELATQGASLEEAYMAITEDSLDYRSVRPGPSDGVGQTVAA